MYILQKLTDLTIPVTPVKSVEQKPQSGYKAKTVLLLEGLKSGQLFSAPAGVLLYRACRARLSCQKRSYFSCASNMCIYDSELLALPIEKHSHSTSKLFLDLRLRHQASWDPVRVSNAV